MNFGAFIKNKNEYYYLKVLPIIVSRVVSIILLIEKNEGPNINHYLIITYLCMILTSMTGSSEHISGITGFGSSII